MFMQLLGYSGKSKETSTRRVAIPMVKHTNKTNLVPIKDFLEVEDHEEEGVIKKNLEEAQLAKLYNEIEKRNCVQKI
ncbi:hypothetical protein LUQ84_001079 [Hamiltosporidium tvaerminnensis]|nr:hypothetical protein LUQ84_001079 [Hamiltosporidium tvaerminnensis]